MTRAILLHIAELPHRTNSAWVAVLLSIIIFASPRLLLAADTELSELSIEQLIDLKVTSVSKKEQSLGEAAAAISVITQEDIHRSGATSVAELLRMVPGVDVGRINSNTWKISARGFGAIFSNKLLVLVDGRSVYTPLFAGVFWDEVDLLLEDIDRIEVIRGPGATLWGSNAVNGVINIITKSASDSQGGLVTAGGGTEEQLLNSARYGGKIGDETSYRVHAKYFNRDGSEVSLDKSDSNDRWQGARGGFRVDSNLSSNDSVTLQSDAFYGQQGVSILAPTLSAPFFDPHRGDRFSNGANVIGRWTHAFSDTSDTQLQLYYDRVERDDIILEHHRDTFDLDLQHRFSPFEQHDLLYGVEYRHYRDDITNSFTVGFNPTNRDFDLVTLFIQDEITLIPERLKAIIGTKVEHNDFTGSEYQPNARLVWTVNERNTIWSAVSRAVRLPSRSSDDLALNLLAQPGPEGLPVLATLFGDDDVRSDNLLAYEIGYRSQLTRKLTLDLATFFNDYTNLESFEPGQPFFNPIPAPHVVAPLFYDNQIDAQTYGAELALEWRPLDYLKLAGYYSVIAIDLKPDPTSLDALSLGQEGQTAKNQFMLRSLLDLPHNMEFDSMLRYVENLPDFNIDSYFELELRLAWRPAKKLEIAVIGQNLLDSSHEEAIANFVAFERTAVERGVYGKITWQFD